LTIRILPIFLSILIVSPIPASAKAVRIFQQDEGYFTTNLSGEPNLRPPYLRAIRSTEEFDRFLGQYETLKGRYDEYRLGQVKRKFRKFNYQGKMLIAIFSQPLDQFSMSLKSVEEEEDLLTVNMTYRHERLMGRSSNRKKVFFLIIAVPKSSAPIMLNATEVKVKRNNNIKPSQMTGLLMEYGDGQVQLVVETKKRGKKSTYYIKDPDYGVLQSHFGKKVTIEGYIKPEGLSAYEWEMTFKDLVKVYEPEKRRRR